MLLKPAGKTELGISGARSSDTSVVKTRLDHLCPSSRHPFRSKPATQSEDTTTTSQIGTRPQQSKSPPATGHISPTCSIHNTGPSRQPDSADLQPYICRPSPVSRPFSSIRHATSNSNGSRICLIVAHFHHGSHIGPKPKTVHPQKPSIGFLVAQSPQSCGRTIKIPGRSLPPILVNYREKGIQPSHANEPVAAGRFSSVDESQNEEGGFSEPFPTDQKSPGGKPSIHH